MLASVTSKGFACFPQTAIFPLLPKHVHALTHAEGPQNLGGGRRDLFLSSNGNLSSIWFRCLAPLRVQGRLIGAILLGDREGASDYPPEILHQIGEIAPFIASAIHNHQLMSTLQERTVENLRLVASVHSFWDDALEAFAATIDVKDPHMRGHSLRVGNYAAGIGEALGLGEAEKTELRAAGFLHDIGKVTVDKRIFSKASSLGPGELLEMIDHTVAGHQIVSTVQFPWNGIPEAVRSHHERVDGSGYPDKLRGSEVSLPVKILAVADTFDAMLSDRPYRRKMSLGECAAQLSWLAPSKLDADVVHALMIQLRRDASHLSPVLRPWSGVEGKTRKQFLDPAVPCDISPIDIDNLVSEMNRRLNRGRAFAT